MSDLVRTVAAVFRRKGANAMPAAEFKHALSLDLRWLAPADARRLVQHAVSVGVLEEDGDALRPRFDVARVDVPVTFRPTLSVLDETPTALPALPEAPVTEPAAGDAPAPRAPPPLGPGEAALRDAARLAGEDLEDLRRLARDERERRGRLISEDVAALLVARRLGVDVREAAARARARRSAST